jgi:methylmalonyl-CoA mutase
VATARETRAKLFATRRETITGVTDFPLLDAAGPEFVTRPASARAEGAFAPVRWAEPFEALRDAMEARKPRPAVFFANLASLAEFGPRAQWTRNLLGAGGVGSIGPEEAHATMETLIDAFRLTKARVAVITGADARYAEHAENAAQRLKAAGADWVMLAGKPGESETKLRTAGVDQFVFAGQDAVEALRTVHAAFGAAK